MKISFRIAISSEYQKLILKKKSLRFIIVKTNLDFKHAFLGCFSPKRVIDIEVSGVTP